MTDARLVVCVPSIDGWISGWTFMSLFGLLPQNYQPRLRELVEDLFSRYECRDVQKRLQDLHTLAQKPFGLQIDDAWFWPYDLVRVRSRAVRKFLHETDATHLLFVDSDVSFEPIVISKMLATGKELISVPYPKRDIRWQAVYDGARAGKDPRDVAYEYVFRTTDTKEIESGVVQVAGVGMGCTLIARPLLRRMWDHFSAYRSDGPVSEDIVAWDNHETEGGETVYLFALQWGEMNGKRHLFGEDLSFCRRALACGAHPYLYIGDGAPASHYGSHHFVGTAQGFVEAAQRGVKG